jgi:adenosine 3'-phospho 5'-phosphosulfate transporter B2
LFGFLLLCTYVISDSFTSQWQSKLYKEHGKVDHFQMMYGVNVSSIIITSLALLVSGEIFTVVEFLWYNPAALYYNIVTAITSTTGQFAIYYTIKKFGPIVFTVIMTTRQMLSIVFSNYLFGHVMTWQSYVGAAIVFSVLGLSTYRQYRESLQKEQAAAKSSVEMTSRPSADKV